MVLPLEEQATLVWVKVAVFVIVQGPPIGLMHNVTIQT